MNKALVRTVTFLALTSILAIPYFNCGAPTDQGLFGAGSKSDCVDPTKPELCYGDPAQLFLLPFQSTGANMYKIFAANGGFNFEIACSDGGYPRVMIRYRVIAANGQPLVIPGDTRCNSGRALVFGQLPAQYIDAWTAGVVNKFSFQIFAYAAETATEALALNVAGTQEIRVDAIKVP